MHQARQPLCCQGMIMGKFGRVFRSLLIILMFAVGVGFIEGERQMGTGGQVHRNSGLTKVHDAPSVSGPVSQAFGGGGATADSLNIADDDVMDRNDYVSFSTHADMVSKMTPGLGRDGDGGVVFEQLRDGWHENDAVYYGDERTTVLEPGAIVVLGFGLIGLFTIMRLRFRK